MDSRYGTTNAPTNVGSQGGVSEKPNHSTFNYSCTKYMQGLFGAVMPVDLIEVIPGETVYIQNNLLVEPRYPLVRRLKNGVNVRMNYFYMRKSDLWEDFDVWYSGGIRGNDNANIKYPMLDYVRKAGARSWADYTYDQQDGNFAKMWAVHGANDNRKLVKTETTSGAPNMMLTSLVPFSPYAYMGGEIQLCNPNDYLPKDQDGVSLHRIPTIAMFKEMWYEKADGTEIIDVNHVDPRYGKELEYDNFPSGGTPRKLEHKAWVNWVEGTDNSYTYTYDGTHSVTEYGTHQKIDALRFVMYCRVCRDIYFNHNLLMNNKLWYPDNENHFKLRQITKATNGSTTYAGEVNCVNYDYGRIGYEEPIWDGGPTYADSSHLPKNSYGTNSSWWEVSRNSAPILNRLYFKQWGADYFTSASPFEDLMKTSNFWNGTVQKTEDIDGYIDALTETASSMTSAKNVLVDDDPNGNTIGITGFTGTTAKSVFANVLKTSSAVDMNEVRKLLACNKMLQLVGSINTPNVYNTFTAKMYGTDPNNNNGKPTYIGGYNAPMMFTDVPNYTDAGEKLQGTKVSNGILATSNEVGEFHVKDHGYIMGLLTIDMDSIQRAGNSKEWWHETQMDIPNPMFEGTKTDTILKRELKVPMFENTSGSTENRDKVWAYTLQNEYVKSRVNRACNLYQTPGLFKWDNAQVISRTWGGWVANSTGDLQDANNLNNSNLTMHPQNVDLSLAFNNPTEVTFNIDLQSNIKRNMPLVNKAIPRTMW